MASAGSLDEKNTAAVPVRSRGGNYLFYKVTIILRHPLPFQARRRELRRVRRWWRLQDVSS